MKNIWLTADWHLGEPRMGIMQRPFDNPTEMYNVFRENFNKVVAPDDVLIIVGDVVCAQAVNPREWVEKIATFNGKKTLIEGNHDVQLSAMPKLWGTDFGQNQGWGCVFEKVIHHGAGIELDIQPQEIAPPTVPWCQKPLPKELETLHLYLTHYPTLSRVDRFNIVGHIHAAWKYQKNMLNVGVDVNHFMPFHMSEIAFYLTAITNFYDDDVWCAMHRANAAHLERGKSGSYFKNQSEV